MKKLVFMLLISVITFMLCSCSAYYQASSSPYRSGKYGCPADQNYSKLKPHNIRGMKQ
jgi:hypothetical protein